MATRTVVCPDCNEPLLLGRLSCSNCGSLLASVAGAPRRLTPLRTVNVDEPPWLSDDNDLPWMVEDGVPHEPADEPVLQPATRPSMSVVPRPGGEAVTEPDAAPANAPDSGDDAVLAEPESVAEPEPVEALGAVEADDEEPAAPEPELAARDEPEPVPDPESSPDVEPVSAATEHVDEPTEPAWVDVRLAAVSTEPPVEAEPAESVDAEPPDALAHAPAGAPGDVDDAAEPPPPDVTPAHQLSAWPTPVERDEPARAMRPSHSTWSRLDLGARPAAESVAAPDAARDDDAEPGPASPPAGAWVPPALVLPETSARTSAGATRHDAAPRTAAPPLRAELPFDAPSDLPTWLVAVGSGIATLGFLLPWAAAAPGATGWTQRWGLADPSHGFVLLASAILLGLSVVPNRLPAWVRAGVAPIGLGGLLVGLVWPSMLAGSGMQLGAVGVTIAALTLVVGGVIGVRGTRDEDLTPPV